MKRWINGKIEDISTEEITAMEEEKRVYDLIEKSRPFTAEEVYRLIITQQIDALTVDDNTALRMAKFYPEWAVNTEYTPGCKVQRNGKLWRVVQAHTSVTGWEPENTPALWEQINETHTGTIDDPIPYEGNMSLEKGSYYVQNYEIYFCNRDTVNPVYNALSDLVGLYVEVA